MRKKFLSILVISILTFTGSSINASANNFNFTTESQKVIDSVSESVLQKGLYQDAKVQKFDSLIDAFEVCHDMTEIKDNLNQKETDNESVTRHVENCVIVKTEQDIAFDTENVIAAVRYDDRYYIQYKTDSDAQAAVEIFESYPTVSYAITDKIISYNVNSIDSDNYIEGDVSTSQDVNGFVHYTWGADAMSLPVYADYISRTAIGNVVVAVLDSGVKAEHELFKGRLLQGYDFYNNDDNPADDSGHGTRVAGIIADCTQGLNVKILPVKMAATDGWGVETVINNVNNVLYAIDYAINEGADIINFSFGGERDEFEVICEEFDKAVSKGIIVVVPSGNGYAYIDSNSHPAHKTNIIVTAAVDSSLQDYHEGDYEGSDYGPSVDVTAPGVEVVSAYNGLLNPINNKYIVKTGTSLSAPHISAAAAMLKFEYPNYSCAQMENLLRSCAIDLGESGYDQHYGAGLPVLSNLITFLPFLDISRSDGFYDDLLEVYTRGYITGGNYFKPADYMNRQDAVILFYRMANGPFVTYRNIYNDVSKTSYFANAAVWAYDNGIMKGNQSGHLGVDDNIIRQDFIVALYRYAKHEGLSVKSSADLSQYTDQTQVSEYARTAIKWGIAKGIIGKGTTSLNPLNNTSRKEVVTMIKRFINAYNL